jgi:hypothetical protein
MTGTAPAVHMEADSDGAPSGAANAALTAAERVRRKGWGHERGADMVLYLPPMRRAILSAVRLAIETMVVPTVLLAVLLHTAGLVPGLLGALGWCYLCVLVRWLRCRRMPGTLVLSAGVFTSRTCVALATSSVSLFLFQPILGSCAMAALFVGSALIRRPVTARLARDFIHLPAHITRMPRVQRMFRDVALLWGLSRLADAGMNLGMLHHSADTDLLARGLLSPILTAASVLVCAAWGWRCMRASGVRLQRARPAAA